MPGLPCLEPVVPIRSPISSRQTIGFFGRKGGRELPLNKVLEGKVRHAGETGVAFVSERELFP
jgi:hypothetical protein